jgi:hypothetical protein
MKEGLPCAMRRYFKPGVSEVGLCDQQFAEEPQCLAVAAD